LAVVVHRLGEHGFILDSRRRNQLAWDLLAALSNGVDELPERWRKLDFKPLSP
jgi:hypothetical protein